jgi:hypothetical protein
MYVNAATAAMILFHEMLLLIDRGAKNAWEGGSNSSWFQ